MDKFNSKIKEYAMFIFISLMMAFLIIFVCLLLINQKNTELEETNAKIETYSRELIAKQNEIEILNDTKEDLIAQIAKSAVEQDEEVAKLEDAIKALETQLQNSFELPDYVVSAIAKHGYSKPKKLLETLSDNNPLIPVEGVLGGTMRWWPESSALLTDKYAFANFEDGHILGYALLEYTFDEDNNVTWSILSYYMN